MIRTSSRPARVGLLAILALLASFVMAGSVAAQETGNVTINKTDAMTGGPVEGACFQLRQDDAIHPPECTDATGTAVFEDIGFGEYMLEETTVPPGYAPVADQQVTVDEAAETVDVTNDPTTVTVNKVDAETGEPLADACFFVTDLDEEGDYRSDDQCTDESGQTVFMYVPFGEYRIYETQPPAGYDFQHEPTEVVVSAEDPHPVVEIPNFRAPEQPGILEVDKLDCVGADEPSILVFQNPEFPDEPAAPEGLHPCAIGHAVFEVTGGDLEEPMRLATNIFGFMFAELPEGDYQIREIEPNAVGPVPFSIRMDEEMGFAHTIVVAINPLELAPGETVGPTPTPRTPIAAPGSGGGALPDTSSDSPVLAPWLAAVILAASTGLLGVMVIGRRRNS